MPNIKSLYGKYVLTLSFPETFQELAWRVGYLRRNRDSWRQLVNAFKPSTTNLQQDLEIKDNTIAVIDRLERFYESAATIDTRHPDGSSWLVTLKQAKAWPRKVNASGVPIPFDPINVDGEPIAADAGLGLDTGLETSLNDTVLDGTDPTSTSLHALRMQAANPLSSHAAENITQDILKMQQGVRAIFNSYGVPWTETRGEFCSRWVFDTRNAAFKATALLVQEYPWLMQIVKAFDFFTADVVTAISEGLSATTQLYGHLESPVPNPNDPDDAADKVDSPRHLLTPLWSADANTVAKTLDTLGKNGSFILQYAPVNVEIPANSDLRTALGAEQDLLSIYCSDTYETNAYGTNYPFIEP